MTLFLSRARLRRDAAVDALAALLVPAETGARTGAAHRLVWALFADGPDRRRDFLWREEAPGRFLLLSRREPADAHGLFEIDVKPFEPSLAPGDRLGFALRANPVVARRTDPAQRHAKHHDVVMDALRHVPPRERAAQRRAVIEEAGRAWLARQGEQHGFAPDEFAVDGYETFRVPRGQAGPVTYGRLDFEGRLTVRDPDQFLARLVAGFGRARAFGCGLMLIRRA